MITSVTVIRQMTACNSTLMEVNRLICFILRGRLPTKTLSQLPADRRALRRHCEDTRPTSLSFWSNPTHGMLRRRQTRGTERPRVALERDLPRFWWVCGPSFGHRVGPRTLTLKRRAAACYA